MRFIAESFQGGGFFMWPILVTSLVVYGIAIERFFYLFMRANFNKDTFLKTLHSTIYAGQLDKVVKYTAAQPFPLARIIHAGLLKVRGTPEDVQAAMDGAALRELPKIETRTPFLSMLGNIAMLLGLLGTISGMIVSFAAVANVEASSKATELARGISEAMNCTAFGLLTAIPSLIFYAILQGKTQSLVDDINESVVRVLNLILENREKLAN
jgi:biopolymer transport protein ExbB/TolQ